jgi:hypothetical protein
MKCFCDYLRRDDSERPTVPCSARFGPAAPRIAVKEGTRLNVVVDFDIGIR